MRGGAGSTERAGVRQVWPVAGRGSLKAPEGAKRRWGLLHGWTPKPSNGAEQGVVWGTSGSDPRSPSPSQEMRHPGRVSGQFEADGLARRPAWELGQCLISLPGAPSAP